MIHLPLLVSDSLCDAREHKTRVDWKYVKAGINL